MTIPTPRLTASTPATGLAIGTCVACGRITDIDLSQGSPRTRAHSSRTAPSCDGVGQVPRGVLAA